jgi:hypothetical protein
MTSEEIRAAIPFEVCIPWQRVLYPDQREGMETLKGWFPKGDFEICFFYVSKIFCTFTQKKPCCTLSLNF